LFSDPHKHINTLCGQNVELLNVKPGGTHSNHLSLEAQLILHPISTRNISYLFPPQTSQQYYENEAFLLPICTISTAVKAMGKSCAQCVWRDLNIRCCAEVNWHVLSVVKHSAPCDFCATL